MDQSSTVQGFWHGPDLGVLRSACLRSFLRHGHSFHLYVYKEIEVPEGVVLRDANEIIPYDQLFYYENPRTGKPDLGPFSDVFRFKLLYDSGGWWSDVDTICLTENIPKWSRAWASEIPEKDPSRIGTSQLAFQRKDPLALELFHRAKEISKTKFSPREALGPILLSNMIREKGLPKELSANANLFFPIRWIEMFTLWLPEFTEEIVLRSKDSIFMPIYQSFSQYIGLDSRRLPPIGSYLHILCDDFGLAGTGESYEPSEVWQKTKDFLLKNESWAIDELRLVRGDGFLPRLL
jgi:hypothetical protein